MGCARVGSLKNFLNDLWNILRLKSSVFKAVFVCGVGRPFFLTPIYARLS